MHRLWVFAAALLFSTGGAAIKGNSLTVWQVASFRSLVAAIALSILLPSARRGWTRRHLIVALAYAAMLISFVTSTRLTTAANAIFLQSTAPAYLIVLSPLLLREHIRRSDLFLLLGCATGMALFFAASEPAQATAPDPVRGNLIGALSGFWWALTVAGLRWVSRTDEGRHAGIATVVLGNWLAFVLALPAALPVQTVSPRDVLMLLYLGVFQIGLAYVCLTHAIERIPAFEASTLLLIEPVLNPVWTWVSLGERPSNLAVIGGVTILVSTMLHAWWRATKVRPSGEASRN
jgi:drug/metabolite transporter (DMT)-like permease